MKIFHMLYGAAGVLLAAATVLTGNYGLSKKDMEIYDRAVGIEDAMAENGFCDFSPSDYKIRFFNGSCDYVVTEGEVAKEDAAFGTFVGTAYEIDGEYQVVLPTYENFSELFTMLNSVQSVSDGEMHFGEANYSGDAHAATLWHEAFHAWQLTNWADEVFARGEAADISEEGGYERIVVNEVDSDSEYVLSFSQEMELLQKAYESDDTEEKCRLTREALALAVEMEQGMSAQAAYVTQYFQTLEGSARYVEAQAYRLLAGEEAWSETYMGDFNYSNGAGKYYAMGMLKCLLLDQLAPEWKDDFTATADLDEFLQAAVGGR